MACETGLQIVLLFFISLLSGCISSAEICKPVRHYKDDYVLLSSAYKTTTVEDFESCYIDCLQDERCKSINYYANGTCELNSLNQASNPSKFVPHEKSIYADARDPDQTVNVQSKMKTSPKTSGNAGPSPTSSGSKSSAKGGSSSPSTAASSCKKVLESNPTATSGIYWIKLKSKSNAFQVYCDMNTDGGGWTLVYSYNFTDFANFADKSNAVRPIPTWPVDHSKEIWVASSTRVPLTETSYSAMDYTLWKEIGTEFLVKSNITHWVSCVPGTGDLVNWKEGSLTCRNIKNVATVCLGYAPVGLQLRPCGPCLYGKEKKSIYFDGSTSRCFPVHDSCGTADSTNHFSKVTFPGGSLYIK